MTEHSTKIYLWPSSVLNTFVEALLICTLYLSLPYVADSFEQGTACPLFSPLCSTAFVGGTKHLCSILWTMLQLCFKINYHLLYRHVSMNILCYWNVQFDSITFRADNFTTQLELLLTILLKEYLVMFSHRVSETIGFNYQNSNTESNNESINLLNQNFVNDTFVHYTEG